MRIKLLYLYAVSAALLSSVPAASLPSVSNVVGNDNVGQYGKFEVKFNISGLPSNCNYFWPFEASTPPGITAGVGVSVDLLLSNDSWQTTLTKPAFYYQPYKYEKHTNYASAAGEWAYPEGNPVWCARFAPYSTGTWQYRIKVQDSTGTVIYPSDSSSFTFSCIQSNSHGPLRVSAKDPRYFEHADGTPFNYGIGLYEMSADTAVMESSMAELGSNGVHLLRCWWQSYNALALFGIANTPQIGGNGVKLALSSVEHRPGRLLSWEFDYANPEHCNAYLDVYCKPSTTYKISAYIKTVNLQGTGNYGIYIYNPVATPLTSPVNNTNNDWQLISVNYSTGATTYNLHTGFALVGATGGNAYISDFSIQEVYQDNSLGPNLVDRPHPDVFSYASQFTAWRCDRMLDICQANEVYLKIVTEEKKDAIFGRIDADGTIAPGAVPDESRVYATTNSANRRLQTYFWRWLMARFGHSPAIHSWELFNEADPFASSHYAAAEAFASFIHTNNPNRQMVSTSCWHSYPTAELWGNPKYQSLDYTDLHLYTDVANAYNGVLSNSFVGKLVNVGCPSVPGSQGSLQMTYTDTNSSWFKRVPIIPSHDYKISAYIKYDGVAWQGSGNNASAAVYCTESTGWWTVAYPSIQFNLPKVSSTSPTTIDWAQYNLTFTAKPDTCYMSLSFALVNAKAGRVLIDDIKLQDTTTGAFIKLPGSDFESIFQIYSDSAQELYDVGNLYQGLSLAQRPVKKPIIRGETGLSDSANSGGEELPALKYDNSDLWLKKKIWAQIGPSGIIDMVWWREKLDPAKRWKIAKPYWNFMSDIPINNGKYVDAEATASVSTLRAWGQKDLTNNQAHLWIDNAPYTWKALVDHEYTPEPWDSAATYALNATCGSGSPVHIYKSLQGNNQNHPVTSGIWWQDTGAFDPNNNPALPGAVSGTVTLSGFAEGIYRVRWFDTSLGLNGKDEYVQCVGGYIQLSVSNLVSDTACKIIKAPGRIVVTPVASSTLVIPSQNIIVTVNYRNDTDFTVGNVRISVNVPAELDYVEGSAESSGGVYNTSLRNVSWTLGALPPHNSGSKTYRGKVK